MIYVDRSSMERVGRSGRTTAWVWEIFRSDQVSSSGAYRSHKYRLIIDCEKDTAGSDTGNFYSAYGKLIQQDRVGEPNMAPVVPGTALETAAQFFCSGGKRPPRSLPVYDPNRDSEHRFHLREREAPPIRTPAAE